MMLDVFKSDAFGFTELVAAINKIPYVPTKIGSMGLFQDEGIYTLSASIEMQNGVLTLVQTSPRGSPGPAKNPEKRTLRDFRPVHMSQRASVMADEVLGIRVFGSQTETEVASSLLARKLAIIRRDMDLTHEWQRMGALKGIVLDADGSSVLYNFFTEFGVSQQTLNMALTTDATKVRGKCVALERLVEDTLGGVQMDGITALCSKEFFDALVDHPAVVETFKYTDGAPLRTNQRMSFEYGGVMFTEYRGSVNGTRFIASGEAYAFPTGVPDLFKSVYAPADYMDAVGSQGVPFYAMPEDMDFKRGVHYEAQSNPLHICTRPDAVIKLTIS
jgi:hypothetical protein